MLTKQRTARRSKPGNPAASPAAKRTEPGLPPLRPEMDPEIRRQMIARAAYYRAEQRGFAGGSQLQDWLEAEGEIDRMLAGSQSTH